MEDDVKKPPFDEFLEAGIAATVDYMGDDLPPDIAETMRKDGREFDLTLNDIDSLDIADIAFSIEKALGVKINVEQAMLDNAQLTWGTFYDYTESSDERFSDLGP